MNDFLRAKRQTAPRLAELLRGSEPILAPGAYDSLSARMIEQAGFPADHDIPIDSFDNLPYLTCGPSGGVNPSH